MQSRQPAVSREMFFLSAAHGDHDTVKKFVDEHKLNTVAVADIVEGYRLAKQNNQEKSIKILADTFAVKAYLTLQEKKALENKLRAPTGMFVSRTFTENQLRTMPATAVPPKSKL